MASRSFLILILAGGLISLIAMGSRAAFGLFLEPVSSDLGWGREVFGLALAIQNIVWACRNPSPPPLPINMVPARRCLYPASFMRLVFS